MDKKNSIPIIQIIGHPGCGKTTLMVELIEDLVAEGISVASLKHSAHNHELDKLGKDSFLHRQAGASPAAMMSGSVTAIYLPTLKTQTPDEIIGKYFSDIDIVLIEGWISGPYRKIEVYKKECGRDPLFNKIPHVKAFITDSSVSASEIDSALRNSLNVFGILERKKILEYIISHYCPK